MKLILTGVLAVVAAMLVSLYFSFAVFFRVNAEKRSANRQTSPINSANQENAGTAQKMKAAAGE
jgi:hypothetical protein